MNLFAIAGISFVLGLSGAMMPGPLLTVTISETIRRGLRAGPLLIAGHALVEGVVVLLLFAGLGKVIERQSIFAGVALAGAVMLLWMAIGMLRGLPALTLELKDKGQGGMHPVLAGAAVSLANPYFTLWWATVGMGYLAVVHKAGIAGVLVFYLFHILSDFVWYSFISGTVNYGRRFMSDRVYRLLVGTCAVFLLFFGGYFGLRGIQVLTG